MRPGSKKEAMDPILVTGAADITEIGRRCLCLQSRMTARAVTRHYNAILAPLGLEVTQFSLLAALAARRDSSISQLADRLAFERTTLVRNLKRLADRGLIQTAAGTGRAVRYVPTDAGEDLLVRAIPLWRQAQGSIEGRLESSDGELVRTSLRRLRHATRPIEAEEVTGG
jgi:DNA-binding MarR family transcriptional regulator